MYAGLLLKMSGRYMFRNVSKHDMCFFLLLDHMIAQDELRGMKYFIPCFKFVVLIMFILEEISFVLLSII